MAEAAVALTGDPDLGLKAAREIAPGEYGVLEYAANSAATCSDALLVVGRYLPLINDAVEFSVRSEGNRTMVQLDSRIPIPRAAIDFQSAACHIVAQQRVPSGVGRTTKSGSRTRVRRVRMSTSAPSANSSCASRRRGMASCSRATIWKRRN